VSAAARAAIPAALAALAAALYAPNAGDYFLGDDFDLIGSFFGEPASYLVALLWSNESGEAWKSWGIDPALGRGYLRPLKIWLLAADFALWRTNPLGYHLTSSAAFAASVVFAHALLRRALPGREALAAAGAAVLAVHPVFAETVPFITAREEILVLALGLAALWCFQRQREEGRSGLGFAACFGLALLVKESAVVFLGLAIAHDLVHGRLRPRRAREAAGAYAPALALLAGYLALRWIAFGNLAGGDGQPTHFLSLRALGYHGALFRSLGDETLLAAGAFAGGAPLAAALALAPVAAAALAWRRIDPRRRRDLVFFGPLFYLCATAPYVGLYFSTRHHALVVTGLVLFVTIALGALLDAGLLARERRWAAALALAGTAAFLPPSLVTAREWRQASATVRALRQEIEERTADLPDGSRVLVRDAPQWVLPPFYFGWGLLAALRAPFTPDDLADRCRVVNPLHRRLNRVTDPLPDAYDRTLELDGGAIPEWMRARYARRLERDQQQASAGLAAPGPEGAPAVASGTPLALVCPLGASR
jgi:hypothetical protein